MDLPTTIKTSIIYNDNFLYLLYQGGPRIDLCTCWKKVYCEAYQKFCKKTFLLIAAYTGWLINMYPKVHCSNGENNQYIFTYSFQSVMLLPHQNLTTRFIEMVNPFNSH